MQSESFYVFEANGVLLFRKVAAGDGRCEEHGGYESKEEGGRVEEGQGFHGQVQIRMVDCVRWMGVRCFKAFLEELEMKNF